MRRNGLKLTGIIICAITAAAGCTDPVRVTNPQQTSAGTPSFDGGGWFGTGNRTDTTTTNPTATSQGEPEVTADGGGWFGTGN